MFFVYLVDAVFAVVCGGAIGTNVGWLVRSQLEKVHLPSVIVCTLGLILIYILNKLFARKFGLNYRKPQLAGQYTGIIIVVVSFVYLSNK